jgi:hypothetical protein
MSVGEVAARKDLSELQDHTATLSTAFLASEERVLALEAKVGKKGAKAAAQTKDTLLSESEEEGSTEDSDSDDDAAEPPKKSIKLGTLSDVLINKIMKVNLTRDWTSDVNKSTFKFNKCIYKGIRSAVKLIEGKKPSQGRDALLKVNQKLGERGDGEWGNRGRGMGKEREGKGEGRGGERGDRGRGKSTEFGIFFYVIYIVLLLLSYFNE